MENFEVVMNNLYELPHADNIEEDESGDEVVATHQNYGSLDIYKRLFQRVLGTENAENISEEVTADDNENVQSTVAMASKEETNDDDESSAMKEIAADSLKPTQVFKPVDWSKCLK